MSSSYIPNPSDPQLIIDFETGGAVFLILPSGFQRVKEYIHSVGCFHWRSVLQAIILIDYMGPNLHHTTFQRNMYCMKFGATSICFIFCRKQRIISGAYLRPRVWLQTDTIDPMVHTTLSACRFPQMSVILFDDSVRSLI